MKLLWLLWLFVVLPEVLGQAGFGRSYLRNSRLCHQWNCINLKLGFPDSLPPQEQTEETFRRLLPAGSWQDVVAKIVDNCYNNRTRRFTNTCPGQALMHCVVDQMIDNCPEGSLRKDDSCSPVSSLAGLRDMFTQSRYDNLEKNLPRERRPSWFLKNYFDSKCCDLPVMFNTTVLEECGFSSFMNYYTHGPRYTDEQKLEVKNYANAPATTPTNNGEGLKIVDFSQMPSNNKYASSATTPANNGEGLKIVDFAQMSVDNDVSDPLNCCDMTQFIQPAWRSECDFHLFWGFQDRLVLSTHAITTEAPVTTTTEGAELVKDLMLLPHSCDKEACVFRKLGVIGESGAVDIDAYMKVLQNFTNEHPSWAKAKARVFTKCLVKPAPRNYDTGCQVNDILSCTLDVLTENCPYTRKSDKCKHGKHDLGCQISSSRYRPKHRREVCLLPELVHHDHLSECGLQSLYRAEHVAVPPKPRKHGWFASKHACKDTTVASTCLMNKMGVLNKYNFMDYFKMKDRIRHFTSEQPEWAALLDIYMSAFMNVPMYTEHCNSQKKLLNVIDTMLMTCPISKRVNSGQCNQFFMNIANTAPVDKQNVTREKLDEILKHYYHVFMPTQPLPTKFDRVIRKKHSKIVKKPVYEFGILNSKEAPTVKVITVKPESTSTRPLIIRPVYLQPNFAKRPYINNDGVFRSNPFWLHDQIARAHSSTSAPIVHTVPTVNNNVYSTRPMVAATVPTYSIVQNVTDYPIEMLKPE